MLTSPFSLMYSLKSSNVNVNLNIVIVKVTISSINSVIMTIIMIMIIINIAKTEINKTINNKHYHNSGVHSGFRKLYPKDQSENEGETPRIFSGKVESTVESL